MTTRFVFPGSFSPPTYAHQQLVLRASELLPHVAVVCSTNPSKSDVWFGETDAMGLWQTYELPANVSVMTFAEAVSQRDQKKTVMVRGVRDKQDYDYEYSVLQHNHIELGIDNILIILAPEQIRQVSSTRVRRTARMVDLLDLAKCVSPGVVTRLLEKVLSIQNLFLVVGRPGSGKSTALRMLTECDRNNIWVNTDSWSADFVPLIRQAFPDMSPQQAVVHHDAEVSKLLAEPWLQRLATELKAVPKGANVFVESAYGLGETKQLFRYVGAKVLSIECSDVSVLEKRNNDRKTPAYRGFIERIPGPAEVRDISNRHRLEVHAIDSSGSYAGLTKQVQALNLSLQKGEIA